MKTLFVFLRFLSSSSLWKSALESDFESYYFKSLGVIGVKVGCEKE
jgi:hypothetical protein